MINQEYKGIRFVLKDGSQDCYDPVSYHSGLTEDESNYIVDNTHHIYKVSKLSVASFTWYDICQKCNRELEKDGMCGHCEYYRKDGEV